MEHLLRDHQRKIKVLQASTILFLAGAIGFIGASSADQKASQPSSLDFANGLYARKMYGPAITEYEKFLRSNPDSPEASAARFRYADSFYFSKDYAGAIAHFDVFLRSYPQDKRVPLANFRMGTARFYQGDRSRAIRTFVRLADSAEDPLIRAGSKFYLAKCLENKGHEEKGFRLLEKLIKESPQNEYASYAGVALGDHFVREGNFSRALQGYSIAAANQNPSELARQAQFKVAEIYYSQKNYADAALFYGKVFDGPSAIGDNLKEKSLVGLFYCDYNKSDLSSAERRFSENRPIIEASVYRSEINLLLAGLLADAKKYEDALKKLEEILTDQNTDETVKEKAYFKKVSVLSQKGDKERSLAELEKLFSSSSKSADKALFEKAELLAEIGKIPEAIETYKKVIKDHPSSEYAKNALFQSAIVQIKSGQQEDAKKNFKDFASRYKNDANADLAYLQIIQIDLDAKAFSEAFEAAEKFIKDNSSSQMLDIAYYKLGVAATGLGRFGHAAVVFRKVTEEYPSSKLYVESLYGTAGSLENARQLEEAIAIYENLLRDHPEHALSQEVLTRLGYLYIQNNDNGKVLAYYEDLIFNKKDVPIDTDGVFWLVRYLLNQGLYDRLEKILGALDTRFPEKELKHEIFFFQAEVAMGLKDYTKAAGLYAAAVSEKSEGAYVPQAYLGRGVTLAAMNQDVEAEKALTEALKYDHELSVAIRGRFEIANLRLKAKNWEEAAKAFMLVAILYDDPKYTPPSLYKAGECFLSLGKTDDAEKAFTELKTKYPDSDWAQKVRSLI